MAVSKSDPERLYALIEADNNKGGVYVSYDRGDEFKAMSHRKELVNRPFYYCNIYAHPNNADIIYSNANRFMISKDAGETWEIKSTPHGDNHDIWINPENDNIWIQSNDGGEMLHLIQEKHGQHSSTNLQQKYIKLKLIISIHTGFMVDNKIIIVLVSVPSLPPYPIQAGPNAWILSTEDVKLDLLYQTK